MDLLKHLGFFAAVADTRHFGNAAADLGMTQPPLSQGILRLERHLGVRLFDRDARGVRITAAGRRLLPAARELLDAADDLVAAARDLALPEQVRLGLAADLEDAVPGLLRVVAGGSVGAGAAGSGGPAGSGVSGVAGTASGAVVPTVAGSVELVDLLRDGLLDVAVVRHPGVLDGLTAGPVLVLPTRLVGVGTGADDGGGSDAGAGAHGGGRVGAGRPGPGAGLAEVRLPVAVPPRHYQPPAHDQLVDALRRAGHSGAVIEARDAAQRRALVAAGVAAGIVPVPVGQSGPVSDLDDCRDHDRGHDRGHGPDGRDRGSDGGPGPEDPGPSCPPLRLRVALPHAPQRRPEVDHDAVAAALERALGAGRAR
ncbi:LysR family transcriptional regulator [Promicromonospora sp. NPDC059942]|uniref:LysR family transcriptional regulator n=1 Tax=Promicromonospora sp. NPDC059942 TaxID=3347009 RepID=UPI003661EC4C